MTTEEKLAPLIQIIRESFPDIIDEDLSIVLVNILFVSDIYVSEVLGREETAYPYEVTLRGACFIVASAITKGIADQSESLGMLAIYNKRSVGMYRLPADLEPLRKMAEEKLRLHPWVMDIVQEF